MLKILIAIDGSALSLDAVHHAVELARNGLNASVVLANVQEPASLYELVVSRDPQLIAQASEAAGEFLMAPARVLLDGAGVAYEVAVGVGDPANTLVDMIESLGCNLAILGARGQGAISSALLGSVSQAVAHASPVPVTIVQHASQRTQEQEAQEVMESDSGADMLENFRGD